MDRSGEESLLGDDLNYFKEGLRAANNKLFYGELQMSNGTNATFYGMKIIPRFIFESNFLNSGMFLKFNATSKEEYPSFSLTYNEFSDFHCTPKSGSGNIEIYNNGLSLAFDGTQITALDTKGNKLPDAVKLNF